MYFYIICYFTDYMKPEELLKKRVLLALNKLDSIAFYGNVTDGQRIAEIEAVSEVRNME